MTPLCEACLEILLLFLAFVSCQDFGWIFGAVGFGIRVGNRTSIIQSVPRAHKPRISKCPRSSPWVLGWLRVTEGFGCLLLYGATKRCVANRGGDERLNRSVRQRSHCDVRSRGHLSCTHDHVEHYTSRRIHHSEIEDLPVTSRSGVEVRLEILAAQALCR
jgi:hypothetical protein